MKIEFHRTLKSKHTCNFKSLATRCYGIFCKTRELNWKFEFVKKNHFETAFKIFILCSISPLLAFKTSNCIKLQTFISKQISAQCFCFLVIAFRKDELKSSLKFNLSQSLTRFFPKSVCKAN